MMEQGAAEKITQLEAQIAQMGGLLQQNVQQTQQLVQQLQQQQQQAQPAQPMEASESDSDGDNLPMPVGNWDMVLRNTKVKPVAAHALSLVAMLQDAPPFKN